MFALYFIDSQMLTVCKLIQHKMW